MQFVTSGGLQRRFSDKTDLKDHLLEQDGSLTKSKDQHEQFEKLVAVRDSLINEIEEHFSNNPDFEPLFHQHQTHEHHDPNELNDLMSNDELENMAYEVFSGKRHVKGHMLLDLEESNQADLPNEAFSPDYMDNETS